MVLKAFVVILDEVGSVDTAMDAGRKAVKFKEFNRGAWNSSVEGAVRNYSERNPQNSVVVLTGTNGEIEKMGSVSVPKYMWKLVFDKICNKNLITNTFTEYFFHNHPRISTLSSIAMLKLSKL
jgi:hypothetical protein